MERGSDGLHRHSEHADRREQADRNVCVDRYPAAAVNGHPVGVVTLPAALASGGLTASGGLPAERRRQLLGGRALQRPHRQRRSVTDVRRLRRRHDGPLQHRCHKERRRFAHRRGMDGHPGRLVHLPVRGRPGSREIDESQRRAVQRSRPRLGRVCCRERHYHHTQRGDDGAGPAGVDHLLARWSATQRYLGSQLDADDLEPQRAPGQQQRVPHRRVPRQLQRVSKHRLYAYPNR